MRLDIFQINSVDLHDTENVSQHSNEYYEWNRLYYGSWFLFLTNFYDIFLQWLGLYNLTYGHGPLTS